MYLPLLITTNHVYKSDALSWLKEIQDQSIDLVITDPPYESLEKHRAVGTTTRLKQSKGSATIGFVFYLMINLNLYYKRSIEFSKRIRTFICSAIKRRCLS